VLKIGRHLTERNEFVAFAIRHLVDPGLHAALDLHCSGGWIHPPRGQKQQRQE
jgi:hypothetical protein